MQKALILAFILFPALLFGQDSSPFPGSFVMEGYLLQEDTLTLTTRDQFDEAGMFDVFTFDSARVLSHNLEVPDGMGICGNGLFYVDTASYKFRKKAGILVMDIVGGHLVENSFRYKAKYSLEPLTEGAYRLVLLKVKRKEIIQDGQMPYQTSASSIQEHTPTGLAPGAY